MTRWFVGLSNGENFTEGVAPFDVKPGQNSPWLRLIEYIKKNNLKITSLSLKTKFNTFNLPSAGKRPKFRAFYQSPIPLDFNFYRQVGIDTSGTDTFAVIEAIYGSYSMQIWVDEKNINNSWNLLKEINNARI